jgi:large subunit ribosomal protein L24
MASKLKKGDQVIVLTGKDKGKKGEIIKLFPAEGKAIVSGINLFKKHQKASMNTAAGIISKESPIRLSKLAIVDPKTGKPSRVGFKILENGDKVRVAKKSGEIIKGN